MEVSRGRKLNFLGCFGGEQVIEMDVKEQAVPEALQEVEDETLLAVKEA